MYIYCKYDENEQYHRSLITASHDQQSRYHEWVHQQYISMSVAISSSIYRECRNVKTNCLSFSFLDFMYSVISGSYIKINQEAYTFSSLV